MKVTPLVMRVTPSLVMRVTPSLVMRVTWKVCSVAPIIGRCVKLKLRFAFLV